MLVLVLVALGLAAELPAPAPPPPGDPSWQTVKVVDGITLTRAHVAGRSAPWGRAEGEIAAPIERVIAHLTDFNGLRRYLPRLSELRVLSQRDGEAAVYFRFDLPWPVTDRDWTLRYRWRREGDHFVLVWTDANELGPPANHVVRVSPMRGSWELWRLGPGKTGARYTYLAELGGRLPHGIVEETAWKQPLQTFRGVRSATVTK